MSLPVGKPTCAVVAVDVGYEASQRNPSPVTGSEGLGAAPAGLIVFNAVRGSTGIPVGPPMVTFVLIVFNDVSGPTGNSVRPPEPQLQREVLPRAS